jgi:ATP-dependent Clp protease ATP-binding subunit ClpB
VKKRLLEKDIRLEISPDVLSYLAKEGYNPHYGARPLKRLIQNKILNPVAGLIIGGNVSALSAIYVGIKGQEFTFEIKKNKRAKKVSSSVEMSTISQVA